MLQQLLFEMIQVVIGQRSSLSRALTMEEWKGLYDLLKKHALLGVGYVAIQKLPREQWPPKAMILQWVAIAQQIRQRNLELSEECNEVVTILKHDGIESVVIKGQSNMENYPEELRDFRSSGDIDLWTKLTNDSGIPIAVQRGDSVEYEYYKGVRGIIEYARLQCRLRGDKSQFKPLYYHVEYHTGKGTEVEMHYRPSFLCSPIRNMRMQRWFKEQFDVCLKNKCQLGFPVLTSSVNVIYQLVHLYRHVFEGGVGLRQLMDYYFALRVWHNDAMECKDLQSQGMWSEGLGTPVMSAQEVMAVIRSFGMAKFAGAVMSAQEVMAVIRSFGMGKFAAAVMYVLHKVFENEECILNEECSEADDVVERELSQIKRELKEIGPQADEVSEQQLFTHCKFKEEFIKLKQVSSIGQQLKEKCVCEPWMICEPNEKEGKKLLEEIMKGGNFGQYDNRDAALKNGGMVKHGVWKLKRVMRLVRSYPEEALWEPVFRVWHLGWRKIHG